MCVNVRWRISERAEVWNGESMTLACSAALNGFSVRVIVRSFFHRGYRRSTEILLSIAAALPAMSRASAANCRYWSCLLMMRLEPHYFRKSHSGA